MSRCPLLLQASFLKLALPYEVPTLGVVAYGVVAWTRKKKGANRDQHSRDQRARSGGLWSGGLDPKRGANRDQHSRDQRGRWFFKGWGIVMIPHRPKLALPYEVPTLGVVAYGVVAWTRKKKGANRDQHSRDQRARSGGLWSGGLDPKRGANRDQHSRDQRGRWFFKGWGVVMIPHRPSLRHIDLGSHRRDLASEQPVSKALGRSKGNLRCKFQFSQGCLEVEESQFQGFAWRSRLRLQRVSTKEFKGIKRLDVERLKLWGFLKVSRSRFQEVGIIAHVSRDLLVKLVKKQLDKVEEEWAIDAEEW
ncbi:hypothetical protein Tco_0127120 [Tanacetum coccineum]